jgi:hypothetical protein
MYLSIKEPCILILFASFLLGIKAKQIKWTLVHFKSIILMLVPNISFVSDQTIFWLRQSEFDMFSTNFKQKICTIERVSKVWEDFFRKNFFLPHKILSMHM